MEQASSAFSTGVPALAAIPQLAGNSRQGFGLVDGTMRWASGWVISSNTLGLSTSLYDSDAGSRSTGKERDAESGNDYFAARYYSSSMGRFLSPDPITVTPAREANPQEMNLYPYVRNNPLVLTDPTGMIINTDDLSDKDKKLWGKVSELANKEDANGNYVNPALHDAYDTLDKDSRVFKIEDNSKLGDGIAGLFEITKFSGVMDFSEAKINLNFDVVKGISSTTSGDFDSSFQKYSGLLGKGGFIARLAETFGHEASHGVFAIFDPQQATYTQWLINSRDAAMAALPSKGRYPLPPDVAQMVTAAKECLVPTERFAQQQEKIINGELKAAMPK